jgi:hypothetical protein
MAITRKPKASAAGGPVDVEALINKGGSIATQEAHDRKKPKEIPVVVRIPSDLLDRIDALVATRQLKTPRHTWLLEALLEKAHREEGKEQ